MNLSPRTIISLRCIALLQCFWVTTMPSSRTLVINSFQVGRDVELTVISTAKMSSPHPATASRLSVPVVPTAGRRAAAPLSCSSFPIGRVVPFLRRSPGWGTPVPRA